MMHSINNSFYKGIIFFLLFLSSIVVSAKEFTVVIDPGHGGKDFGANGFASFEKNVNLAVAKKLNNILRDKMKDVKVVMTRKDDVYLTLQERSRIANRSGGDLFISIHTNSVPLKSRVRNSIHGAATYTLGLHKSEENLEVAKRENSVIELENDFSETYKGFDPNSSESYIIFEINQSQHMEQSINFASQVQKELSTTAERTDNGVRQAGFWVLATTSMPAVLIELDFICNPTQEKFLNSDSGQEKLATAIFNAIKNYKSATDNKLAIAAKAQSNRLLAKSKEETKKATIKNNVIKHDIVVNTQPSNHNKKSKSKKNKSLSKKSILNSNDNKNEKQSSDDSKLAVKSQPTTGNLEQRVSVVVDNKKQDNVGDVVYKVQFLTSKTELDEKSPEFKKLYPIDSFYENGQYNYTYGETRSMVEAKRLLSVIKSRFNSAYIVKFHNGKRIN